MWRSRFLWKLYTGYVALVLTTTVIVGWLVSRWLEHVSLAETRNTLHTQAILVRDIVKPSLLGAVDPDLQRNVERLATEIDRRITVIRADGVVIADSDEEPAKMDNHLSRPEVRAVQLDRPGESDRRSDTVGERMKYLALAVASDGQIAGYVRISLPLDIVVQRLAQLRARVLLGAAIAAAVALGLGWLFARRVTGPLAAMTRTVESIARGDYRRRMHVATDDEIGVLAYSFNEMADQLEERLETITRERNELRAVLGGMVEGVIAIDGGERVLHMNDVAGRILDVPPDDALGKPIWEVIRAQKVTELLMRSIRQQCDVTDDLHIPQGARDAIIEMSASPLRNGEGRPAGAVVVLHDVTELRRLEVVRRDFVANVSHELKTPLTAIRGVVETLIDDETMEPVQQRRFLGKLHEQCMRLSAIVTDLLTLSGLESRAADIEPEPVDLRNSVQESVRVLRPAAETKKLSVETDLPQLPVIVVGDDEALQQVVGNLLDNAIKYTPEGGQIWLRVRAQGDNAYLEVQDTGIGIELGEQERIFERFYRVDKTRSRELGGTGLGLSIVKHTALSLGGDVSVQSTLGAGSTFRVRFPLGHV